MCRSRFSRQQERPAASVVLSDTSGGLGSHLREAFLERLPKWQVPDEIVALAELPKGPTGKVDKRKLRMRRDMTAAGKRR